MRAEVQAMARAMEAQLQAHDDRPGWKEASPQGLYMHLLEEVAELGRAIGIRRDVLISSFNTQANWVFRQDHVGSILQEAADINNMSMMVADTSGVLNVLRETMEG